MNYHELAPPLQEPRHPPAFIPYPEQTQYPHPPSSLSLLQLNAHRSEAVLQHILQDSEHHILLIQEPWISRYTLLPVIHPSWHLVMPMGHHPTSLDDRAKTCIYISKVIPTKAYMALPTGSALLTAIDLDDPAANLRLRLLSWYNPPADFCGIPVLREWLRRHNRRSVPTLLGMDSNLHHKAWNPVYRRRTHPQALDLMQICGSSGFKLTSPKGVPTFYPPRGQGKGTTIDLVWTNYLLSKRIHRCEILSDTFGSDHQAIVTVLDLSPPVPLPQRNSASLTKLDVFSFQTGIEKALEGNTEIPHTTQDVDTQVQDLTDSILHAFHR